MSEQDGIDYEALAKAIYFHDPDSTTGVWDDEWEEAGEDARSDMTKGARAAIACYQSQRRAQGYVEVLRSTGRPET